MSMSDGEFWDRFIEEVCDMDFEDLNDIEKTSVLVYSYAFSMEIDGFTEYKSTYLDDDPDMMYKALLAVGGERFADNFKRAYYEGAADFYESTDTEYDTFSPDLFDYLMMYIYNYSLIDCRELDTDPNAVVQEKIRMEEKRLLDQTYALNQAKREGREEGIGIGRESERVRLMSLWRDKGFSEEQIKELLGE